MSQNPFLKISEIEQSEDCLLYRAVRWIAFKEKPISETFVNDYFPYQNYDRKTSHTDPDCKRFYQASHALLVALKQQTISAWAEEVHYAPDGQEDVNIKIPHWEWVEHSAGINWNENILITQSDEESDKIYSNIKVKTADLVSNFPITNDTFPIIQAKTGRKCKYQWAKKIIPIIVEYFRELDKADLDVNNMSKNMHSEKIYEICADELGEENTPDPDYLEKAYVKYIVDWFSGSS